MYSTFITTPNIHQAHSPCKTTPCKLKIRAFKNKTTILRWYFDSISFWFDNDFGMESKYYRKIVVVFFKSSNLDFTRCFFSECVFPNILLNCPLVMLVPLTWGDPGGDPGGETAGDGTCSPGRSSIVERSSETWRNICRQLHARYTTTSQVSTNISELKINGELTSHMTRSSVSLVSSGMNGNWSRNFASTEKNTFRTINSKL